MIRSKIWAADLSPLDARRSAATLVEDFVEITAGRLPDIAAAMGPDGDRAAGRFARGSRCFAIEEGGSIDDPAEKADADAGFSPVLLCEVRKLAGVRMVRLRPAPGAHPGLVQAAHQRLNLQASRTIGRARGRIH